MGLFGWINNLRLNNHPTYCKKCGLELVGRVNAVKYDINTGEPTRYNYTVDCPSYSGIGDSHTRWWIELSPGEVVAYFGENYLM